MSKAQGLGARPGDGELLAYGYNSQGRLLPDTMILIR
jgi:YD repeat-containing protein